MVQPLVNECPGRSMDQLGTPGRTCRPCWAAPGPFPVLGGKAELLHPTPARPLAPAPAQAPRFGETRLLLVPWLLFLYRKISSGPPPPPPHPRASSHAATAFIQPPSQHLEQSHGCPPPCVRAFVRIPQPAFTPFRAQHIVGRTAPLLTEGQLMGSGSEFPFQHSSEWIPNLCLNTSVTGNLLRPWFCCRIILIVRNSSL